MLAFDWLNITGLIQCIDIEFCTPEESEKVTKTSR